VLTRRQHHLADADHILLFHRVPNDVGFLAGFTVWNQIIGAHDEALIDVLSRNELLDLDRALALELDRLEFFILDWDASFFVELISLTDIITGMTSFVTSSMFCWRSRLPVALFMRLRLIFFSSDVAG